MPLPNILHSDSSAALERLWLQVCASRGTLAPDAGQRGAFLQALDPPARAELERVLLLAAHGRERPGELGLLIWAESCMRPALIGQLQNHGLAFTGAGLFASSLKLREAGWNMPSRIAQLHDHPEDVATLRGLLPTLPQAEPTEPVDQPLLGLAAPGLPVQELKVETELPEALSFWPDDGPPGDGSAPGWQDEPLDALDAMPAPPAPSKGLPPLPTRFEHQAPGARPADLPAALRAPAKSDRRDESQLRLRLFGKSAAHTLEVTAHRRGGDFMGVHVVSIDSAHALPAGGGYAWERKLVLQLTPEEMPAVLATLMGITPTVRFGHHGATQAKFVELRRQERGLVLVTGEHATVYSVPVPTATLYYMLDLFCRAMAMNAPGRSVSDILALVKAAHGF
ncbi:MAG: hypothetical protein JWR60_2690 [Polaromonas sp.]|nr:hypothetical protein [Polaromonas sp.]